MDSMEIFEHLSVVTGLGVSCIDLSGSEQFKSAKLNELDPFLHELRSILECNEADKSALLYGCYQARRFGGRYVFLVPSGLTFCVSPLCDNNDELISAVIAGPFLMTDHDEYIDLDILDRYTIESDIVEKITAGIYSIPYCSPAQARSVSELLYACVMSYAHERTVQSQFIIHMDMIPVSYSIQKESELLAAISAGNSTEAGALLNDILGHILFSPGVTMEALQLRVFELTILLSRAALKGGANIDAILGLKYSYLREIDALKTPEDTVLWLHNVTKRFSQHVFDYSGSKHTEIIQKAIEYIKGNYEKKLTLQNVADSVYLNMTYFAKLFKDETGQTPGNFITATRIEAGKKLLLDPSVNLVDIADMIGFESQSYFNRIFKNSENCTPAQYRRMNRS